MSQTGEKSTDFVSLGDVPASWPEWPTIWDKIRTMLERVGVDVTLATWKPGIDLYARVRANEGGEYRGWGINTSGRAMRVTAEYDDPQGIAEVKRRCVPEHDIEGAPIEGSPAADSAEMARNRALDAETRSEALGRWMTHDPETCAQFVAEELSEPDLSEEWRDVLVFAAEDVQFTGESLRRSVEESLKRIAVDLRGSRRAGVDRVVWSALRRFASLVDERHVGELRDFLDPNGYVDTRLVALQGIARVFEHHPPQRGEEVGPLADRAHEIAKKLLDADVFASGETSAIATQAVMVLCVLGDRRALECIDRAKALGRQWVGRKLRDCLGDVRTAWLEDEKAPKESEVFQLVDEALTHLE